jgi:hypothetical protein
MMLHELRAESRLITEDIERIKETMAAVQPINSEIPTMMLSQCRELLKDLGVKQLQVLSRINEEIAKLEF